MFLRGLGAPSTNAGRQILAKKLLTEEERHGVRGPAVRGMSVLCRQVVDGRFRLPRDPRQALHLGARQKQIMQQKLASLNRNSIPPAKALEKHRNHQSNFGRIMPSPD